MDVSYKQQINSSNWGLQFMGVGSVKLGRGQLEFRGGTEKKLNLSSIKPHVIYVYF